MRRKLAQHAGIQPDSFRLMPACFRAADRTILTACQQRGTSWETFRLVSAQLGNKTAQQVRRGRAPVQASTCTWFKRFCPTGEPSLPGPDEAFLLCLPNLHFLTHHATGRDELVPICCCWKPPTSCLKEL